VVRIVELPGNAGKEDFAEDLTLIRLDPEGLQRVFG
jgi:hypothetical protein